MDELLTEQIIMEATGDFSSTVNFGTGTASPPPPKSQSPSANRSLLKQLSSKLLPQSASTSKSANNENVSATTVNSATNHSGSHSNGDSVANSLPVTSNANPTANNNNLITSLSMITCPSCSATTVSLSSNSSNGSNGSNGSNSHSASTSKIAPNNSTSSLNSALANQSGGHKAAIAAPAVQTTTRCDQVNCKTINSLNNCSINESQSSTNQSSNALTISGQSTSPATSQATNLVTSQSNAVSSSNEANSSYPASSPSQSNPASQTSDSSHCNHHSSTLPSNSSQPNPPSTSSQANSINMTNCNKCLSKFTVFRRKHQCNKCNKPFCYSCLQKIKIKDNKLCLDCSLNEQQSKSAEQQAKCSKTMGHLNSLVNDSLQVISKQVLDQSINLTNRGDDCTDAAREGREGSLKEAQIVVQSNAVDTVNGQLSNQINNQINSQLNNQITSQLTQLNSTLNDLEKANALNANLSINSNISTSICSDIQLNSADSPANSAATINSKINLNINSNINLNMNLTNASGPVVPSSSAKNDFVIISVLKKQGVAKTKCAHEATTTKKVCFSDGIRPGDESIIEQQRTTTLLPSLITMNANLNANLMANLTATGGQIPSSRISFKPFLAHSQLTYAQKGLLHLNTQSSSTTPRTRTSSKSRHLSSSHRQQLSQQKLIQLSATSATLRNTAATYTVLTKTGAKLNQSAASKHLASNGSTRSSSNASRKFVYLTNGKLLVNNQLSYSTANYNDYYIKNTNDMFQNEKLFTSYVLLA